MLGLTCELRVGTMRVTYHIHACRLLHCESDESVRIPLLLAAIASMSAPIAGVIVTTMYSYLLRIT